MSDIKIGACDWGLPGAGLHAMKIAAEFGLEALSLKSGVSENNYPLFEERMQDFYLDEQQHYGIAICAIALNDFDNIPMFSPAGTDEYEIVWHILKGAVNTAIRMKIPIVQVPGFAKSEIKNEADMEKSAECLRWLCDETGRHNIAVAFESLLLPDEFVKLKQMVDRPNFGLYYDSQNYHVFRGLDQLEILEKVYPFMVPQLHVKDGNGAMSGSLLGQGDSNFRGTMEFLAGKGYSGIILLENYYDQLPLRLAAESPYDLLAQDVRTLKDTVLDLWK